MKQNERICEHCDSTRIKELDKHQRENAVKIVQTDLETMDLCFSCWAELFVIDPTAMNLGDLFQYFTTAQVKTLWHILDIAKGLKHIEGL